jgi:membrane protease YdiL (CAAX protease family)
LKTIHRAVLRSRHFHTQRGSLLFILAFVFASLIVSFGIGAICELAGLPGRTDMDNFGPWEMLFVGVIFAPILETLLTQMLPVSLARRFFRADDSQAFLAASVPFALLHLGPGFSTFLAAGIPCGVFLGLAYVSVLDQGKGRAFLIVLAIHALHNLPACLLMTAGF